MKTLIQAAGRALQEGDTPAAVRTLLSIVLDQQKKLEALERKLRDVEHTADDARRSARRGF
jgi:hypothetical protein